MSITDQFWQYAKEAMLSACDAKTDDERQGLLELARTWTHAALVERQSINRASLSEVCAVLRFLPISSFWGDDPGNV
jgi:hypothetical protein